MSIAKGLASTGLVAALLALLLTPIFFGASPVHAQPAAPADVYGDSDAGGDVVAGDVIVASIGDAECESYTAGCGRPMVLPDLRRRLWRRCRHRRHHLVHHQRRPRR